MGEVYWALDPELRRQVAVQVLSADLAGDENHLSRLRRKGLPNPGNLPVLQVLGAAGDRAGKGGSPNDSKLEPDSDLAPGTQRTPSRAVCLADDGQGTSRFLSPPSLHTQSLAGLESLLVTL